MGEEEDGSERLLLMTGYHDCLLGVVERFGQQPIACYDFRKVIAKLMADGMTQEEADEYYRFNQLGAWMGEGTPCFLVPMEEESLRMLTELSDGDQP